MAKINKTSSQKIYDIAIVGGGLSGLTAACIFGQSGFSVLCLDREDKAKTLAANFDLRTTAISYASRDILTNAGIWNLCADHAEPILDIQILDGSSSPVLLNFLSRDVDGHAFGHIINNRDLRAAQHKRLTALKNVLHHDNVTVNDIEVSSDYASIKTDNGETYHAKLIVGADGKHSFVRTWLGVPTHEWVYGQSAIVCCVTHKNPHKNIAVEHFLPAGPLAILPMADDPKTGAHRSSLVWSIHGHDRRMMDCDDDLFNLALNARFPKFYGEVSVMGKRAMWPLGLKHAHTYIGDRAVIIAEAAHAMHPIAGQGLNVGMRDIQVLHDMVAGARAAGNDWGNQNLLSAYQSRRRLDTTAMMAATDFLTRLFSNNSKILGVARKLGVRAVGHLPPVKRFFMHQAMGLGFSKRRKLS